MSRVIEGGVCEVSRLIEEDLLKRGVKLSKPKVEGLSDLYLYDWKSIAKQSKKGL